MLITTTEVPEIQDVEGPKTIAPPPTDQTTGANWTIFGRETPQGNQLRGTVGIFEFPTKRQAIGDRVVKKSHFGRG